MPRGGKRAGAGRKPKSERDRFLDGNAGHRPKVVAHPSSVPTDPAPAPIDEFDAPNDLTTDERNVWLQLAPHAFAARTLTKGTELAFKMLCRNVLLEKEMRASVLDRGRSAHQGLIAKVDAELLRFSLSPCGKPMAEAAKREAPKNPLEKYLRQG